MRANTQIVKVVSVEQKDKIREGERNELIGKIEEGRIGDVLCELDQNR